MKYILDIYKLLIVVMMFMFTSSCAIIYEQDIQQGNVVTDEMLNNLELGMSQSEAQYYLGTALVEDPFHLNRWDYFYTFKDGRNKKREQRVITLLFDSNNNLADITGNVETATTDATAVKLPDEGDLNTIINDTEGSASLWQRMKRKVLGE